jgi:peroxiredoxin
MKRINKQVLLLLLSALILSNCKVDESNFTVEGSFKAPIKADVILGNLALEEIEITDTSSIDAEGNFKLKGFCTEPSLYVLQFFNENIYLIIKPKDHLQIDIDNTLKSPSYYVNGSSDSRLVRDLFFEQQKILDQINTLSIEYEKSKQNAENFLVKKAELDSIYDNLLSDHKIFTENFIQENPNSLANIFALYQNFGKTNQPLFDKYNDINIFDFVDSTLSSLYPNTPAVIALNKDVTEIKEQISFKKYSESLIQAGRKMPDFSLKSIRGKQLSLEENFDENAVVLFFFAIWNKTSVNEALKLNEIYEKYKYLGLKVVGVSFDTSKDKLESFIDTNNITFPVVCDYKYWDSEYVKQFGVRAVPDIILVNKTHFVENRNIKTSELIVTFEEWRKSKNF